MIVIYIVALYAAHYEDEQKRQRQTLKNRPEEDEKRPSLIHYQISVPISFPDPTDVVHPVRFSYFDLKFILKNETDHNLTVEAWVKSPTQAISFVHDVESTKWTRKYLMLPYRRRTNVWLDNYMSSVIAPTVQEELKFHGVYRKDHAISLAFHFQDVPILYRLKATDHDSCFDSGVKRIQVPIGSPAQDKTSKNQQRSTSSSL